MGVRERTLEREDEKMSNEAFRYMTRMMNIQDFFFPYVGRRARGFGIKKGMTVVDYGCGPGRYTVKFAAMVGNEGKVIAADIHEMAIEAVKNKIRKQAIKNIEVVLVDGYNSGLPDNTADMVCALDMFYIVRKPTEFLRELNRIIKTDGVLVIDDGRQKRKDTRRQKREDTRRKIIDSSLWDIIEESKDHLRCRPRKVAGEKADD